MNQPNDPELKNNPQAQQDAKTVDAEPSGAQDHLEAQQDAKTVDAEQRAASETEDEDPAFDPAMFAQVEEMMKKLERVDELERELNAQRDRYARLMADFENYRRRTSQDVLEAEQRGVAKAAETLFPVLDDLSRAVELGRANPASIIGGVETVLGSLQRLFEKLGLEATGKEGEKFDPAFHEALSVVPGDEDDVIVQVYQTGFRMGDRLVRPARVVVAKK
ncbi:molecular chaperone GrpE [Deinobacterium chartae]|uniref:Protein GrpE n=1 Tax=Deinobacterium chartae TaxID=521158 RepID=A0A841I889_9DEIO|nr:nucleotide exchange factor GrpE [Deinobacterium chartae]MBB6100042.1 molecular chaperone GrpE [Deinobacterium chartae]